MIKTLELFGGIGAPRCAFRNIEIPIKAIDYVEIDQKAVDSYNQMFIADLPYKTQTIVGYNLKPAILIHGSPCQDFSIAGKQKGAEIGSETRSSLMWETINIIKQMGEWRPLYVLWENVPNVLSKHMRSNFERYLSEMSKLGYTNSYAILDARDFGLPQARRRVITISSLNGTPFDFNGLIKTPMRPISEYLTTDAPSYYEVTQPSMLKIIKGCVNARFKGRVPIIKDYAMTITCKQMRCPNSGVIDLGNGKYRYLTERECWRLQGFSDADYEAALKANPSKPNKFNTTLYKQAGNSMPVPMLESIFKKMFLNEVAEKDDEQLRLF